MTCHLRCIGIGLMFFICLIGRMRWVLNFFSSIGVDLSWSILNEEALCRLPGGSNAGTLHSPWRRTIAAFSLITSIWILFFIIRWWICFLVWSSSLARRWWNHQIYCKMKTRELVQGCRMVRTVLMIGPYHRPRIVVNLGIPSIQVTSSNQDRCVTGCSIKNIDWHLLECWGLDINTGCGSKTLTISKPKLWLISKSNFVSAPSRIQETWHRSNSSHTFRRTCVNQGFERWVPSNFLICQSQNVDLVEVDVHVVGWTFAFAFTLWLGLALWTFLAFPGTLETFSFSRKLALARWGWRWRKSVWALRIMVTWFAACQTRVTTFPFGAPRRILSWNSFAGCGLRSEIAPGCPSLCHRCTCFLKSSIGLIRQCKGFMILRLDVLRDILHVLIGAIIIARGGRFLPICLMGRWPIIIAIFILSSPVRCLPFVIPSRILPVILEIGLLISRFPCFKLAIIIIAVPPSCALTIWTHHCSIFFRKQRAKCTTNRLKMGTVFRQRQYMLTFWCWKLRCLQQSVTTQLIFEETRGCCWSRGGRRTFCWMSILIITHIDARTWRRRSRRGCTRRPFRASWTSWSILHRNTTFFTCSLKCSL